MQNLNRKMSVIVFRSFLFVLPCAALLLLLLCHQQACALRVMTFNTWHYGTMVENGLQKIAKHINRLSPDIVSFQEMNDQTALNELLPQLAGGQWEYAIHPALDTVVLTKHKIIARHLLYAIWGTGATIQLNSPSNKVVCVFSMHLNYRSYGPYAANNKQATSAAQIMAGEMNAAGNARGQNMAQLIAYAPFQNCLSQTNSQPLIVTGDFNTPSHQDWIAKTKQIHGGWKFEWPATKMLTDIGFVDAFRKVHPNVTANPGNTWSTVWKFTGPEWDYTIPEPQDRIDFVFHKGSQLVVQNASTYNGNETVVPEPNHWNNDWPSDHSAVVADYQWM